MPQRLKGDHPPPRSKDRSDPSESGLSVLCRPLSIALMTEVALGPWPYHLYGKAGWGLMVRQRPVSWPTDASGDPTANDALVSSSSARGAWGGGILTRSHAALPSEVVAVDVV